MEEILKEAKCMNSLNCEKIIALQSVNNNEVLDSYLLMHEKTLERISD